MSSDRFFYITLLWVVASSAVSLVTCLMILKHIEYEKKTAPLLVLEGSFEFEYGGCVVKTNKITIKGVGRGKHR